MKTFIFLLLAGYFTVVSVASAQTMSNDQYKIKMGNFNAASGLATGSAKLNFELGETAPGLYSGSNYKVRAGFQYIKTNIPFSFALTPSTVDFGVVSPNNPVTRTSELTVSNGSANGYTVTISADRQPTSGEGNVIPATTCDNGDCSENKASLWTSTLAYGFGFRCDNINGKECEASFLENYYKPLPISPSSKIIMSGGIGKNKKSNAVYKVNISPSQQPGVYRNNITFIAAPTF
jgi:hypothetical protein